MIYLLCILGIQVWKMPKLWVGFLKCVSQTRPHSFNVLLQVLYGFHSFKNLSGGLGIFNLHLYLCIRCLQLPPPLLESALNKHANLRSPLATYASQPSIKTSLPRYSSNGADLPVLLLPRDMLGNLFICGAILFLSIHLSCFLCDNAVSVTCAIISILCEFCNQCFHTLEHLSGVGTWHDQFNC